MKIAILGAGVSGLALARFLVEGGLAPESISLFEAGSRVGGLCQSKTVEGYTYDVAGGHILYSKDAAALEWMKQCAGGESAFVQKNRNTRIRFEHRWVNYPFENGLGDLPPQANFECIRGYVQAWHKRELHKGGAPSSFGAWVRWRFGEGIARHFMEPYNQKIWKRELDTLTSDWVAGRVPDAPVEDVLRSSVGIRTEGYTHQSIFFYPLRGGFQALTDGIATPLLPRVRLKTPVRELKRKPSGWSVNGEDFDAAVSTLALTDLPELLADVPDGVAQAMRTLEYNGMVSILLGLERREHPDLSWIYLPHAVQGPANRVTFMSNYSPHMAPKGKCSFLCEVTLRGGEKFPGQELEREVVDGMAAAGLLRRDEVLLTDRSEIRHAYVVFDHAYAARRKAIFDWAESVDLVPLGRFGRFEYDNSDQCVVRARGLAGTLLERARRG